MSKQIKIIKHAGTPTSAVTLDGKSVTRKDKIYLSEPFNKFIACAEYDNHFLYYRRDIKGWALFCTCGGPAVIVGYDAYKQDSSPSTGGTVKGELMVCYTHANTGLHADGST